MNNRTCPTCNITLPADAPESLCPRCLLQLAMEPGGSPPAEGRFVAPAPRDLAPFFPQLEIISLIGQGGMGAVYKARQKKLDRIVALKILPVTRGSDPAFSERFIREARALARLQHPNVVTLHDFGESGGYFWLLMEHVNGNNLRPLMKRGPLPADRAVPILNALGEALAYAHQNEVVHRDLKPENVLIDQRGQVKLADFGLAKLIGADAHSPTLTETNQAVGTPHYMAPEQLERPSQVDHRADIYALGVLAYEMLAGELPMGRFDAPSRRSGGAPSFDAVVLKALDRDPARRQQSIGEFLAGLRSAPHHSISPVPGESPVEPPELDPVTQFLAFIGIVTALSVLALGIVISHSGWLVFGLIAIEYAAATVRWNPARRSLVGVVLALGGLAASVALLTSARSQWWLIFVIWFWYGDHVTKFIKGVNPHEKDEDSDIKEKLADFDELAPRERQILKAIHDADSDALVTYPADMDGEALAKMRQDNQVQPDERVLAAVPLSDEHETDALIFGTRHIYFPAEQHGERIRYAVEYESILNQSFVNHGKSVYVGDGTVLMPENETSCESLAALLNAARRAASGA